MAGRQQYRDNEERYGGMPRAGRVKITRADGTVEEQRPLTYRERRNLAATGTKDRRKNIDRGMRLKIYKRDGYRCHYCGTHKGPFQLDHIRPYSKGGTDDERNLVTACRPCNMARGNSWERGRPATP